MLQLHCCELQVNPTRSKKLSNVRSKQSEEKYIIQSPRLLTLEETIGYVQPDELIEVTPDAIRLRKIALNPSARKASQPFPLLNQTPYDQAVTSLQA
jgi:GTP-binding protein